MMILARHSAIGIALIAAGALAAVAGTRVGLAPTGSVASRDAYELSASFEDIAGIRPGAEVRLAGIPVGRVVRVELDREAYRAQATFLVENGLLLPDDSRIRVSLDTVNGSRFLEILAGTSDFMLAAGQSINRADPRPDAAPILRILGLE